MHTGTSKDHMLEMEVLTDENISPAFKRIKYGIRGWLEDRTYEIKQELARVSIIYSERAFQRLIRELKHQTFSTGRRQPEVKFTSDPRFPPTESAVATLRRLCFAYFDVACKT